MTKARTPLSLDTIFIDIGTMLVDPKPNTHGLAGKPSLQHWGVLTLKRTAPGTNTKPTI